MSTVEQIFSFLTMEIFTFLIACIVGSDIR